MFIRDTWYVAAWHYEVGRSILARTILGVPLVFFRRRDGSVAALEDTCPHKFMPLSGGFLQDDTVVCGYHGMTFDGSGRCVRVPGQDLIPRNARARSFPVVERYGWVWIWMGDAERADPGLIIDIPQLSDPAWAPSRGERMHYRGSYHLMTDNLIDPSHVTYVHAKTLSNATEVELPLETKVYDDHVAVSRIVRDGPPAPFFQAFGKYSGNVHRWQVYRVSPPSLCIIDTGTAPADSVDPDDIDLAADSLTRSVSLRRGDPSKLLSIRGIDFLTPETERTTHYFWQLLRNFAVDDRTCERNVTEAATVAFNEDLVVVEAVQRRVDMGQLPPQAILKADAGSVHVRRMFQRKLDAEQARTKAAE
ncbi:aromatic ring-hydroxylating dioxygenase subunit alpha [Alsobacter sp. R-9]